MQNNRVKMIDVARSQDFPSNVRLLDAATQNSFTIHEGLNHIVKRPNSQLSVQGPESDFSRTNQLYENASKTLAILEAKQITIDDKNYTSLEIYSVDSYVVVQRSSGTAVALEANPPRRIYCLGDGDIIRFPTATNASFTVMVPKHEIQVGSSEPEVQMSFAHTPQPSTSLEIVSETPAANRAHSPLASTPSDAIPFSTARAKVTQDPTNTRGDIDETGGNGFDARGAEVSSNHINRESDEDNEMNIISTALTTSITKSGHGLASPVEADAGMLYDDVTQSESEGPELSKPNIATSIRDSPEAGSDSHKRQAEGEPSPQSRKRVRSASTSMANEELDDPSEEPSKRGRPKRTSGESIITVKPRNTGPMVVINAKAKGSTTPSSTATSSRSATEISNRNLASYEGPKPSIVFSSSSFEELPTLMKRFKSLATVSNTVTEQTTFLCIGKGEIKKTSKLLLALAYGKQVLSEQWAIQSAESKVLLDPAQFLARDEERETEWGLPSDWSAGTSRTDLLNNREVFVTSGLKKWYGKGYQAIEQLVKILGARKVTSAPARNITGSSDTIVMDLRQGDGGEARTITDKGYTCYDKEFLSISILRGKLSLDDYRIDFSEEESKSTKKSSKRKS